MNKAKEGGRSKPLPYGLMFRWKVSNPRYGETELEAETCLGALRAAAEQWGCEKWTDIAYSSEIISLGISEDTPPQSAGAAPSPKERAIKSEEGKKNDESKHDSTRGRRAGNADELGGNADGKVPGAGNAVSHPERRAQKRGGSSEI